MDNSEFKYMVSTLTTQTPAALPPGIPGELQQLWETWGQWVGPADLYFPWIPTELTLFGSLSAADAGSGFAWDANTGEALIDWDSTWVVMGEAGGDPVFCSTGEEGMPIMTAIHGIGRWRPYQIAGSPRQFRDLLLCWVRICNELGGGVTDDEGLLNGDVRSRLESEGGAIVGAAAIDNLLAVWST